MILISNCGNIDGSRPKKENRMDHIFDALNLGYQVKIDVWYEDNQWWLGKNEPKWKTGTTIFNQAWCQIKNEKALEKFNEHPSYRFFWQNKDKYTLTSNGHIWCNLDVKPLPYSICFLSKNPKNINTKNCYGICSDYIENYK